MLNLKGRGFKSPKLAVGDGTLGFWKAIRKVFAQTRSQRCWVHKTANILNKLPKHSQPKAKQYIHDIWMAETRENAEKAFDLFIKTYELKYPKAAQCLEKDREELLAFYDFSADLQQCDHGDGPVSNQAWQRKANAKLFAADHSGWSDIPGVPGIRMDTPDPCRSWVG